MPTSDGKIKVMLLVTKMGIGGAERVASVLLQNLDRSRFSPELTVISDVGSAYRIPDDAPAFVLDEQDLPDATIDSVSIPDDIKQRHLSTLLWLEMTAGRLATRVRQREPDVIISTPMLASVIAALACTSFPSSTRWIHREAGLPSAELSDRADGELVTHIMRERLNLADKVWVLSKAAGRDLEEDFGVRPGLIDLVTNPLSIERIQRLAGEPVDDPWFAEDVPIVLFVGRLARVKGVEYLLRAIAQVRRERRIRCVLVGDGAQTGYLAALAKRLGIGEDVHFAGRQTNPFKYMSKATVFVLPSLREGMPNVLLESMACGCPVIASDIEGGVTRELLGEGQYGLVVPREDSDALAEAIARVLTDDATRVRFSESGFSRAAEYDMPTVMRQLEDRIAAVAEGPVSPERDAAARAAAEAAIDAEQPRIEVARPASGPTAARTPGAASDGDGRDEPEPARPDSEQVRTGLRARLAAALGMGRPRAHEDATAQQQQATERRSADPPDASASGRVGGTAESHAPAPRRTSADEIRVAVLVHTLANSEMGSGTLPIASRLDRSKFDVSLVALASLDGETSPPAETTLATVTPLAGPDQAEFAKMLQPDMAESYTDRLAWMSAEARGLAVTLQELGTDVVLAQGFYSALIALMAQRSIPWPVPVVANMHSRANDFVDPSTGGDLYLALIRAMFPQAGAVIAPTEELCEDVVGKFGVPAANVAWVPDPVDGAATRERIESPGATVPLCAPGGSTALWVASPLSGGSLPYVVEGLALARRLEPVRCLVASDASAEFAITSEAARAGVPDAVELVDESSRAGLLQCVSAMLHASSEPETNIPEAIIDAVALGCPVISTTGSEAINEFLGYGERGVLVPRKDAAALAEAILQIIWDPEAARQMTRAAKAHLDEVSADAVLPRLEGILASCVASHDRSSTLQS